TARATNSDLHRVVVLPGVVTALAGGVRAGLPSALSITRPQRPATPKARLRGNRPRITDAPFAETLPSGSTNSDEFLRAGAVPGFAPRVPPGSAFDASGPRPSRGKGDSSSCAPPAVDLWALWPFAPRRVGGRIAGRSGGSCRHCGSS